MPTPSPPQSPWPTEKTLDHIQKRRERTPQSRPDANMQHYTSAHKPVKEVGHTKEEKCRMNMYLYFIDANVIIVKIVEQQRITTN